jgi:hypothetical protein
MKALSFTSTMVIVFALVSALSLLDACWRTATPISMV